MIYHVNAPPGNGKSAFLMYLLEVELCTTKRQILTNLQIKIPGIVEYLAKKYPDIDVSRRICFLSFEQMLTWWRWRGMDIDGNLVGWVPTKDFVDQADKPGVKKEMIVWPTADDEGCLVLWDEVQEFYSQFDSMNFSREHISAISQHRKFRTDVFCACPYLEQLAKPYREIGQGFYNIKNLGYTTKGYGKAAIRMATQFQWSLYLRPPTSERDKPMISGGFVLEPDGIHAFYNTAAGVGVANKLADQGLKRTGLQIPAITPKRIAIAAVVALLVIGTFGYKAFKKAKSGGGLASLGSMAKVVTPDFSKGGGGQESAKSADNRPATIAAVAPTLQRPTTRPMMQSPVLQPSLTIEWIARVGKDLTFGLSDGSILENPVGAFVDNKILILKDGRRLVYKPTGRKTQPAKPQPLALQ